MNSGQIMISLNSAAAQRATVVDAVETATAQGTSSSNSADAFADLLRELRTLAATNKLSGPAVDALTQLTEKSDLPQVFSASNHSAGSLFQASDDFDISADDSLAKVELADFRLRRTRIEDSEPSRMENCQGPDTTAALLVLSTYAPSGRTPEVNIPTLPDIDPVQNVPTVDTIEQKFFTDQAVHQQQVASLGAAPEPSALLNRQRFQPSEQTDFPKKSSVQPAHELRPSMTARRTEAEVQNFRSPLAETPSIETAEKPESTGRLEQPARPAIQPEVAITGYLDVMTGEHQATVTINTSGAIAGKAVEHVKAAPVSMQKFGSEPAQTTTDFHQQPVQEKKNIQTIDRALNKYAEQSYRSAEMTSLQQVQAEKRTSIAEESSVIVNYRMQTADPAHTIRKPSSELEEVEVNAAPDRMAAKTAVKTAELSQALPEVKQEIEPAIPQQSPQPYVKTPTVDQQEARVEVAVSRPSQELNPQKTAVRAEVRQTEAQPVPAAKVQAEKVAGVKEQQTPLQSPAIQASQKPETELKEVIVETTPARMTAKTAVKTAELSQALPEVKQEIKTAIPQQSIQPDVKTPTVDQPEARVEVAVSRPSQELNPQKATVKAEVRQTETQPVPAAVVQTEKVTEVKEQQAPLQSPAIQVAQKPETELKEVNLETAPDRMTAKTAVKTAELSQALPEVKQEIEAAIPQQSPQPYVKTPTVDQSEARVEVAVSSPSQELNPQKAALKAEVRQTEAQPVPAAVVQTEKVTEVKEQQAPLQSPAIQVAQKPETELKEVNLETAPDRMAAKTAVKTAELSQALPEVNQEIEPAIPQQSAQPYVKTPTVDHPEARVEVAVSRPSQELTPQKAAMKAEVRQTEAQPVPAAKVQAEKVSEVKEQQAPLQSPAIQASQKPETELKEVIVETAPARMTAKMAVKTAELSQALPEVKQEIKTAIPQQSPQPYVKTPTVDQPEARVEVAVSRPSQELNPQKATVKAEVRQTEAQPVPAAKVQAEKVSEVKERQAPLQSQETRVEQKPVMLSMESDTDIFLSISRPIAVTRALPPISDRTAQTSPVLPTQIIALDIDQTQATTDKTVTATATGNIAETERSYGLHQKENGRMPMAVTAPSPEAVTAKANPEISEYAEGRSDLQQQTGDKTPLKAVFQGGTNPWHSSAGQAAGYFGVEVENDNSRHVTSAAETKETLSANFKSITAAETGLASDSTMSKDGDRTNDGQKSDAQPDNRQIQPQATGEHKATGQTAAPRPGAETFRTDIPEQIAHQVKERFVQHELKPGHQQISLTLNPENLGELKMNINLQGQRLSVEILTENRTVRDAILQHSDSLKDSLARQNLTVESFDVATNGRGSENPGQNQEAWRELARQKQNQQLWTSKSGYRPPQPEKTLPLPAYMARNEHVMLDIHY